MADLEKELNALKILKEEQPRVFEVCTLLLELIYILIFF